MLTDNALVDCGPRCRGGIIAKVKKKSHHIHKDNDPEACPRRGCLVSDVLHDLRTRVGFAAFSVISSPWQRSAEKLSELRIHCRRNRLAISRTADRWSSNPAYAPDGLEVWACSSYTMLHSSGTPPFHGKCDANVVLRSCRLLKVPLDVCLVVDPCEF